MRTLAALFWLMLMTALGRAQDFQSWNEVDLTASWDKADILVPTLVRNDSSLPNPQLVATGVIADLSLPRYVTLTGGYLFADLPQRSQAVHVPLVAVSLSSRVRRFTFEDRNRFEKLIGFGESPVRYRNRALVDRPFGEDGRWHVFVSDEIFVDLSAGQWNQNRFQVGGGARVGPRSTVDVYYLLRNASGSASLTHVVGITLKVELIKKKKTKQ
jgi:Protein of unknown function (DUF2490)